MSDKMCMFSVAISLQILLLASGTFMKSAEDLPIKYPGPTKDMSNRHGFGEVPDECMNQNFCTIKPPDYPQEMFDKMFKGSKLGKAPNLVITNEMNAEIDVNNRLGHGDENDDCRAIVSYEPLYHVRSKESGDWRVVINSEQENYVQKVRMETCVKPGSKCFTPFPDAFGFETFCKQEDNDWEIVVADGKGGTETITTSLPVCCSCFYRAVHTASRFGKPKN